MRRRLQGSGLSQPQVPGPEYIRQTTGGGKADGPLETKQKLFFPANFRVNVDGEDDAKISHVEALSIKQGNVTDDIGIARDYQRAPTKIDFPNLKMSMSEAHAETWYQWHEDFVIMGNSEEAKHKQGSLQYLDTTLYEHRSSRPQFDQPPIIEVAPDPHDNNSDKIRHVTVEMYMENLIPKWT